MMKKRVLGLIMSIAVFIGYRFIETPQGLDIAGMQTLALLVIAVILWVTEVMPLGISSIFILVMPLFFGLTTMKDFLVAFPNPTLFFVLATFGLSAAITKVPTAKRILLILLQKMGSHVNLFILALMVATALISSIMSNIPATVMFMGVAMNFLELYDTEEERRKTGRTIMIALPIAGMIGGIITPAGSSNNILALGLLEEYAHISIRFIDWMMICIPVAAVTL
ncbi:MAG: SLC13 family permease, partial [Eubacterium sp.]